MGQCHPPTTYAISEKVLPRGKLSFICLMLPLVNKAIHGIVPDISNETLCVSFIKLDSPFFSFLFLSSASFWNTHFLIDQEITQCVNKEQINPITRFKQKKKKRKWKKLKPTILSK